MTNVPDDQTPEDPLLPWIKILEKYQGDIESACRKIGLYVMDVGLAPNPHQGHSMDPLPPVMVVNFTIGDIAFSDRVQNPVEGRMDAEFKTIENQMAKQNFEELRDKLAKALEEGRDPLETDDEGGDDAAGGL